MLQIIEKMVDKWIFKMKTCYILFLTLWSRGSLFPSSPSAKGFQFILSTLRSSLGNKKT